ncbi:MULTISPECIES: flagellar basal body-associated protein FliL [Idiomarina]|jgi:flagellar FliL protein|uniref:Flagellar protein FliL n=1 Tax=Idiomarina abyssalis TaxID=86102 RepID=A0A8I1GCL2_9GAMM|nr:MULTISPECIES: flagellar basal body-associated protein FliL [Idiomarina]RDX34123.1 flagellar basal body-associated protein FliL [Idiomarina sp. HD9-110m-PIT-SAG05]MAO68447.1 flagellar basal body-associated protein FliL [Idiomarina sp.]MBE91598.1 flagellar basal body-associated protein FliL [Idiomarina sp.]MBF80709.1 flagellar basal body-associated protein FliL [Idiomarina sp.]MBJ7267927.1 flagellar basal body-associated protein FliL [Idiomarina abyssalis]|tara:strand:- start:11773 stop:12309 length:537 start_codon:yes stop_codon:yes gene_type:complete
MAEDKNDNEEEQTEEKAGGKKKKLILSGIIGIVLIVTVVLVLWLFGGSSSSDEPATSGSGSPAPSSSSRPEVGNALYVGMPRAFVFIVPGDSRERTVQIKAQLMVRGEENEELAKKHIPLIEGTLHEVFSSSTADRLKTAEGKGQLRELALTEVRSALEEVTGKPVVEQVLFTSLVMQ